MSPGFFNQLDHKVGKNTTKRAKLQTLPRPVSTRAKPTAADFPPNHWGFETFDYCTHQTSMVLITEIELSDITLHLK